MSSYLVRPIEMRVFGLLRRNSQSNFFLHLHALNSENKVCVWNDFATFAHAMKIEMMLFSFESIKLFPLYKGKPLRILLMPWCLVFRACEYMSIGVQPPALVLQLFLPNLLRLDAFLL